MLTSSLLLVATSSRHADVIIAESRFLFASNPSGSLRLIGADVAETEIEGQDLCTDRSPVRHIPNDLAFFPMADLCRSFLDFRPRYTSYRLHLVLPSKRLSSTYFYSPSSRIHGMSRRPFHLTLFCGSSGQTPSSVNLVSTHEHSDGSLVFRFKEPGEAASSVQMEEPNIEKEFEREGVGNDLVANVLDGDNDGDLKVSSLAELTDESNSIVIDSKYNSIVEEENDLDEKLKKGATECQLPSIVSNVDLKDSSTQRIDMVDTGDNQQYLNDEQEISSVKSVSPNFDIISTHEHSDGSLIFRFGNLSKVEKEIEKEDTDKNRMVKDLNSDDDGGVSYSSFAEVMDESNPIVIDGKNLSISEKGNDLGEKSKDTNELELPCIVSAVELKSSTPGNDIENGDNDGGVRDSSLAEETDETNSIVADGKKLDISEKENDLREKSKDTNEFELPTIVSDVDSVVSTVLSADSKIDDNIATMAPDLEAPLQLSIEAEAQTSLEGNELRKEIAEDGSENGVIQLMAMAPQLETRQTIDEESVSGDVEEYMDTDKSKSLKVLDDIPQKSILVSESTEDDDNLNVDMVESSGNQVTEMKPTEVAIKSQDIQLTDFVLSTGAALLPHPSKVLTGGEDAYFISGQTWLGVADGVGQWSFEGTTPGVYAQELIKNCEKLALDCNSNSIFDPVELLKLSVGETQSPGSSTVLLAQLVGKVLQVANIGDSGFIILRHGSVYKRSSPMLHVFHFPLQIERGDDPSNLAEFYRINLEEEDVIILASDGLLDNLYDQEIASEVSKYLAADSKPEEIAQALAAKAQQVGTSTSARSPFADNAQAAGYAGYSGGKLDDVTVIVSVVRKQSSPQAL
ncbi:hypothetical protein F511_17940 [Dorcoceras hygrometricum]|uniref:PPM-type phosphatase domain-containing protein n=1 Tax=Dorcoceras hygrometricum TaxID=472368 RepID=A0A2Z7AI44_9LAMI|nr:hypothetical protein F511_17940 [Dorcoceras hygrometricum]